MRARCRRIGLFSFLLFALVLTGGPVRAGACPTAGEEKARVKAVEQRLELRLDDGRLVRMVGLDPAAPTPNAPDLDETMRASLATRVAGKPATLRILARSPDRWGRVPAIVFEEGATEGGGVAGLALGNGMGRYLAEPSARACRDALLAAEAKARAATLGLWADPYYGVLAVDDRAAFLERSGSIVLAEARLRAVETSPYRTTLRFAAPASDGRTFGGHMLVATIPPRLVKTFKAESMDLNVLVGRRLRFRGLLDLRFGPRVELASPDTIELIDSAGDAAVAAPPN